jgi:hypothetical protein
MAILNNNDFFVATGVGLFGDWENHCDTPISCGSSEAGKEEKICARCLTALNAAGWIPGISLIAGIFSIVLGGIAAKGKPSLAAVLILRGVLQVAQVGIILAPFDIGFSLVRLVREHMKQRATQQTV